MELVLALLDFRDRSPELQYIDDSECRMRDRAGPGGMCTSELNGDKPFARTMNMSVPILRHMRWRIRREADSAATQNGWSIIVKADQVPDSAALAPSSTRCELHKSNTFLYHAIGIVSRDPKTRNGCAILEHKCIWHI